MTTPPAPARRPLSRPGDGRVGGRAGGLARVCWRRVGRRDCCWGPCTHQRRQAPSAERVVLAHQPRDGLLALVVGRDPGAVDDRRALHVRADPLPKGGEPLLQPPARGGRRIGARASGSPPLSAHAAATHPPPPHLREDGAERLRRAAVPRRLAKQAQPPVRLDPNFDHVRRVGERARCAPRQRARRQLGRQRCVLPVAVRVELVAQRRVRCKAEAAVARLPHHRSRKAVEKGENALGAQHTRCHREHAQPWRSRSDELVLQLHPRLEEVERQAEAVGDAAGARGAPELDDRRR